MSPPFRYKNIHVKLDRLTHADFKSGLIKHDLSMQEAFEQFAKLFVSGDRSAVSIIERYVKQRIKAELASVGMEPGLKGRKRVLNELDNETLYDLINEGERTDEAAVPAAD